MPEHHADPLLDCSRFGPELSRLWNIDRLPELGAGNPVLEERAALMSLDEQALATGRKFVDQEMAQACLAGLWLWFDFLDESHTISQAIQSASGSYWHAIMHRREGDFSNSKYWNHRIGTHQVHDRLGALASKLIAGPENRSNSPLPAWLANGVWDPDGFVDLCQRHFNGNDATSLLLRQIQTAEFRLLFQFCFDRGIGLPK